MIGRRLALTYFAYFGTASLVVTYLPVTMQVAGLSDGEIGWVFTGTTALAIAAQLVLTARSDRTGRPLGWLKVACVWVPMVGAALPFATGFASVAAILWLQAPLWGIIVPLLDATTVRRAGASRYAGIRVWGSVGYGLVLAVFGLAVTGLPYARVGVVVVPVYLGLAAFAAAASLSLPRDASSPGLRLGRVRLSLWRRPGLAAFLVFNVLHWAALSPFHIFLGVYARELAFDPAVPGIAVAVGIACEVLAFVLAPRLLGRVSPACWLGLVALTTALRWWATAQVTSAVELVAWQALHGLTFGLWYAAVIQVLGGFGPLASRASLQGLFSAVVFGIGGVVGHMASGQMMELTDGRTTFTMAAGLELLAMAWLVGSWRRWAGAKRGLESPEST